jgi:hypothetical protein
LSKDTQRVPQRLRPVGQVAAHIAVGGVPVPWTQYSPAAQAWPHDPQLFGSVIVFTQAPLHIVVGNVHAHMPPLHDSPVAHAWPQLPQFRESKPVYVHTPPHEIVAVPHAARHIPPEQTSPVAHAWPHAPQF